MRIGFKFLPLLAASMVCPLALSEAVVPGFNSNTLPANDDGSTGLVPLGFTANFFGESFDSVFVNNNGNITFDDALGSFTPFDLTSTAQVIIAPFFADVDTRGAGSSEVTFGQGTSNGRAAFGVNYVDVGFFNSRDDLLNSFQLIVEDRSDVGAGDFDFIFNYDQIQFETGNASDGTDGLGGSSARAGFSNGTGDPGTFFELEGSAINGAFLDGGPNSLADLASVTFEVRNGAVSAPILAPVDPPVPAPTPDPTVVPSPSAAALGLMGLVSVLTRRRRQA